MKCLVVGGAGFIGSHLVDELISKGNDVVVLDDLSNGKKENINSKAKFIQGSVNDDLNKIVGNIGIEYVFLLAAQISVRESIKNPVKDAEINILGGLNLIRYCVNHKVKKIIFSSSAAVYSIDAELPVKEDSKVSPLSPYGLAKLTIENYLELTKESQGLDYVVLRYSNVYGPRQDPKGEAGVISIFVDAIKNDNKIFINGDGKQTRDFIFVKDVVKANLIAMEKLSGLYNVSSNREISLLDLIRVLEKISNKKAKIEYKGAIKGELRNSRLSNEKIRSACGWKPEVSFEDGLRIMF
jgi:UDP-glucose 4-epimerase